MFTGDLAEAKSDRITLQEIDPKALTQLIDFVYTSEIHVTEENVQVKRGAIKSASNYTFV
jgi:kelch-like protein 2/3